MAGDNVGSWFAVGTIGSLITGGTAGIVPFLPTTADYAQQLILMLLIATAVFALIALFAIAGFLNLTVRYLREISENTEISGPRR